MFVKTLLQRRARTSLSYVARSLSQESKASVKRRLLTAKEAAGVTYTDIAAKTGLTNAYVAQLFHRQAHLKKETAALLRQAVPTLAEEDIEAMKEVPDRSFDPNIVQDPTIYRLQEAVLHYGEAIKAIINERFGDGIMSAIDMYVTVDKVKGKLGEDRVVITMNGKYLKHIEQKSADNTVAIRHKTTATGAAAAPISQTVDPPKRKRGRARKVVI